MNPYKVWTVHRNNSEHDVGPVTDVCGTKQFADETAKGAGWYGGPAHVEERYAIIVETTSYLLASPDPIIVCFDKSDIALAQKNDLRRRALAKLSDEERAVLGLR